MAFNPGEKCWFHIWKSLIESTSKITGSICLFSLQTLSQISFLECCDSFPTNNPLFYMSPHISTPTTHSLFSTKQPKRSFKGREFLDNSTAFPLPSIHSYGLPLSKYSTFFQKHEQTTYLTCSIGRDKRRWNKCFGTVFSHTWLEERREKKSKDLYKRAIPRMF